MRSKDRCWRELDRHAHSLGLSFAVIDLDNPENDMSDVAGESYYYKQKYDNSFRRVLGYVFLFVTFPFWFIPYLVLKQIKKIN